MMPTCKISVFRIAVAVPCLPFATAASPSREAIAISTAQPPATVPIAGRPTLVYELTLRNVSRTPLELETVEITAVSGPRSLASFRSASLASRVVHDDGSAGRYIEVGEQVIVFIDIEARGARALLHRLVYRTVGTDIPRAGVALSKPLTVSAARLHFLGPPLRGGPWVAVYDPALTRGHRRVFYTVDAVARLPGRFAIDWMRPIGTTGPGDGKGEEALAVADGTVVAIRDGVPEPARSAPRAKVASGDAAGNFVDWTSSGAGSRSMNTSCPTWQSRSEPASGADR